MSRNLSKKNNFAESFEYFELYESKELKLARSSPSITLFSWREQGESAIRSYEYTNHSSLSDDSFTLYQGIDNYKVPTLSSIDVNSNTFLNTGPRELELFTGDSISFDFAGISKGSSEINFVELEFYMNPLGSKKSKTRKVIFTPENTPRL